MKWHQIIDEVQQAILANAPLVAIYGAAIRLGGTAERIVPLLTVISIGDQEREIDVPTLLQIDQWCESAASLAQSEQILRRLFHLPVPAQFGTLHMWAQYEDGEWLASPDRDRIYARAIRFRFTPIRDLYDPAPTP